MKLQSFLPVAIALSGVNYILCAPTAEGELFITPLIKNGKLEKAKAQAEVNIQNSNIKSYSGYFTIDEKSNSNLFFWFCPAQESPEKAPVILWINEVPGFSSIRGIFLETGPFKVGENNVVTERNDSWTRSLSMLYIDSPVGSGKWTVSTTVDSVYHNCLMVWGAILFASNPLNEQIICVGFSFSDSEFAYANSSGDEGSEIYEALTQFYTLFKEFQSADFYLAGEDYAASFIPYIVKRIEMENKKNGLKINVKGFIIGSPFIETNQLHRGQALYSLGLIDDGQKKVMDETIDRAISMVQNGQVEEGTQLALSTYLGPESQVTKFTGFTDYYNALVSKPPPEVGWFQNFIESKEVQNYLHVGVHKYIGINLVVLNHFAKEISSSHGEIFVEMLNKGYRILIYAPQFNIYVPQSGVAEVVSSLKWNGAEKFSKAPRKFWKVNDDVAGYIKMADNFTYAMVRNAGNYAIMDQPAWMYDLVEKFVYNKEF